MSRKANHFTIRCIVASVLMVVILLYLYFIKVHLLLLLFSALSIVCFTAALIILHNRSDVESKKLRKEIEELKTSNEDLLFEKSRLDLVMEGSSEGFWDWNIATGENFYSNHWYKILGYDPGETKVDFNIITQTIHPDDLPDVLEAIQNNTEGQAEYYDREDRFLTKDGKLKWLLIRGKIVEYTPDGKPARMTGIVKDISEKKLHEEEIKYLSYHDTLTGLYNRAYFERELKRYLKTDKIISIIMGDVNGLKIANDAFGHEKGDQLLKDVAGILTASCRKKDLIARFGGDEFAIILRGADEKTVSDVIGRIETECGKCEGNVIKPSIAIGTVTSIKPSRDASLLMKTAEENMYRNKLLVDRSTHSAIINSLKQALAEKDIETEEHAVRLSDHGLEIGRKMGLKNDELDQLALLAILHDIGKVAISDNILLKPGKLDAEEWETMKQHPAIGYRIAKASPDLSHIAEAILSHHERYDGTGYPQGLKGENIPVISRIISVVDSFDAMTHKRPYKEAISAESALEELKRCSGSQFDPKVVDIFLSLKEEKKK